MGRLCGCVRSLLSGICVISRRKSSCDDVWISVIDIYLYLPECVVSDCAVRSISGGAVRRKDGITGQHVCCAYQQYLYHLYAAAHKCGDCRCQLAADNSGDLPSPSKYRKDQKRYGKQNILAVMKTGKSAD